MPSNYNFTENGVVYNFDDVFVPTSLFGGAASEAAGALWTWGRNYNGNLGINNTLDRITPVTTFAGGIDWKQVTCGTFNVGAIKADGSLWLWGYNRDWGALGINNTINRSTPVTTFAGGNNWKQIACGNAHSAAIKTDGTLWIWGYNFYGQLGISNISTRITPVTTFAGGSNWKEVSCGNFHTVAIKTDGTLWTWGANTRGELGTNNTADRLTPVTTFAGGNNWSSIASHGYRSVRAIKTDGSLWVWGDNSYGGQLGVNDTRNRSTPVTTFAGGNDWKFVSGHRSQTVAIKTDGTLWTWGKNANGELGTNNTVDRLTPVTTFLGGTNWKSVAAGQAHSAAIKLDGSLWMWGFNGTWGPLGINNTSTRSIPVTTFAGGNTWNSVSCSGSYATVAIKY